MLCYTPILPDIVCRRGWKVKGWQNIGFKSQACWCCAGSYTTVFKLILVSEKKIPQTGCRSHSFSFSLTLTLSAYTCKKRQIKNSVAWLLSPQTTTDKRFFAFSFFKSPYAHHVRVCVDPDLLALLARIHLPIVFFFRSLTHFSRGKEKSESLKILLLLLFCIFSPHSGIYLSISFSRDKFAGVTNENVLLSSLWSPSFFPLSNRSSLFS